MDTAVLSLAPIHDELHAVNVMLLPSSRSRHFHDLSLSFVTWCTCSATSSRTAQASSSAVAPTRMAVTPEGSQGQSRGELLHTVWKTALTAGAAQTLLASSSFAEVKRDSASVLTILLLEHPQTSGESLTPSDVIVLYRGHSCKIDENVEALTQEIRHQRNSLFASNAGS